MSEPRARCQATTASLRARCQVAMASSGSLERAMVRWRSARATSLAWTIPPMPSLMAWR